MHQQTTLVKVLTTSLLTGVAGWALENTFFAQDGPRYSYHFPNLPFMPVYAAGGAVISLLEPHVSHWDLPAQALTYGGTLTAVEAISGLLERARGRRSWDYDGSPVDVPHAIAWTVLGTLVGQAVNQF